MSTFHRQLCTGLVSFVSSTLCILRTKAHCVLKRSLHQIQGRMEELEKLLENLRRDHAAVVLKADVLAASLVILPQVAVSK